VEDVKTGLIETRRIIFTPDVDLKDELKNTTIQITCIDRNGKEVKRVTSGDSGTIEDPENENQGGENQSQNGGNTNQGGNQGGNTNPGSGDNDIPGDDD
jgi:hypothetical protein